MQALQDEGGGGAPAAEAEASEGLHAHPDRVDRRAELRGGGWAGTIGWCDELLILSCQTRDVLWHRIDISSFRFEHAATVLVVQGMLLQDFFPPDVYFCHASGQSVAQGPFFLLRGTLSLPHDPPLRLMNMTLAKVESLPAGMSKEEMLGVLLSNVDGINVRPLPQPR